MKYQIAYGQGIPYEYPHTTETRSVARAKYIFTDFVRAVSRFSSPGKCWMTVEADSDYPSHILSVGPRGGICLQRT